MTTPSPIFTINGVDASLGSVPVASGGAIVALLQSTAGVQTTTWTLRATDELSLPAAYVLTPSGTVLQQCNTTALTPGTCGVLEARINNGLSSATGASDPAMTFRGKFYVPTAGGLEVGAAAEYDDAVAYASPTHGMIAWVNKIARALGVDFWTSTPVEFANTVTSPIIDHQTDTTVGGVRTPLTLHAQDSTVAASTGANFVTRPGHGVATHGRWIAFDADGVTERLSWTAGGDVTVNSTSYLYLNTGGTNRASVGSGTFTLNVNNAKFGDSVGSPLISQWDDTAVGGVRPLFHLQAQSTTVGAGTGATLSLESGDGATHGSIQLLLGGSGGLSVLELAPTYIAFGSGIPVTHAAPVNLANYLKGALPSAATKGGFIYVTDEAGGEVPCFSDGTNWRRVTDRAIVS